MKHLLPLSTAVITLVLGCLPSPAWAQAPGIPIESAAPLASNPSIIAKAKVLHDAGKLVKNDRWQELLKAPTPAVLQMPEPSTESLRPREVYQRARKSLLRVGWFYLCNRCDNWHLNLAAGYAISADGGIATCNHCIETSLPMREGYMVAVDCEGNVLPVTAVLAHDRDMDAAIVRVEGGVFAPLALNDQVSPGDAAFLWSDPLRVSGYFSAGIVNRFFWLKDKGGDASTLEGAKQLRMHVSTDWAPGSSGAPVFDVSGNVIGHVATIASLSDNKVSKPSADKNPDAKQERMPSPPLITLHSAVPARAVMLLAKSMAKSPGTQSSGAASDAKAKSSTEPAAQ